MHTEEKRIEIRKYQIEELDDNYKELINAAYTAAKNAYAPYSLFRVGASVLLENGIVESASNQENVAYPSGMCAERVVLNYVTAKYKANKIKALAIVSPDAGKAVSPCGACRQVMAEIIKRYEEDFEVIMADAGTAYIVNAGDLLPFAFDF